MAGCRGPRSEADLKFLSGEGILALVRLAFQHETGLTAKMIETKGIEDCCEPVPDFTAPSQEQIDRVIQFIRDAVAVKKPLAVSCGAGYGRTGTILACYFVYSGRSASRAIQRLISVRPCSKELLNVPGQKEAICEFERRLKGRSVGL